MFMFNGKCVKLSLNFIPAFIESSHLFSFILELRLQLLNAIFKKLFLRLNVPRFFFLLFNYPLEFLFELCLNKDYSLVIFGLHFSDYSLIHIDHVLQGLLYSVSLTLQILNLIPKDLVFTFQISYFADLFLKFFEKVCIFEENVVSKLAGSIREITVGSFAILFRLKFVKILRKLSLVLPTN